MGFAEDIQNTADEIIETLGGETVTYYNEARGVSREITAIVEEKEPEELSGVPHGNAPVFIVSVKNSSTEGISSDEIDLGTDLIELIVRAGTQYRKIAKIIKQDAGMMTLMVR